MTSARANGRSFPVEDFLQALTAQLDRAQDTLALKVRAGRPLTWALKDLAIDLMVFVEVDSSGRVLMRSAAPNEAGASTLHLNLTTITKPMVEENTYALDDESDSRPLDDIRQAASLDASDQRKLDVLGVRTVGQLRRMSGDTSPQALEGMIGIPVSKLRAALEASARPMVSGQEWVKTDEGHLLRIHGANLTDGIETEVRLAGDPVEVLEATPQRLLVRPLEHHTEGQVEVFVKGERATGYFRPAASAAASRQRAVAAPGNGRSGAAHPPAPVADGAREDA